MSENCNGAGVAVGRPCSFLFSSSLKFLTANGLLHIYVIKVHSPRTGCGTLQKYEIRNPYPHNMFVPSSKKSESINQLLQNGS